MTRIIVASPEPPPMSIELAPGVYEVPETRAVKLDAKGEPVKVDGKPVIEAGYVLPVEAVEVAKADRTAAIKPRTDLDPKHPWYGYRFASVCFAGDGDRVMGNDGEWHAVSAQADLDALVAAGTVRREVEPKEPDVKPAEGEVIRGK